MAALGGVYVNPNPTPTSGTGTNGNSFLDSIIPGLSGQQNQVSGIITNLLNGTPSPSTTREATATFGNANGLGTGSGIVNNYGYNLYNQQGQANQQAGISDLLNTISGYSSPALANQGQQFQNNQYYAGLNQNNNQFNQSQDQQLQEFIQGQGQQQGQFDTTNQLNSFLAQLQALGLGNTINSNTTSLPAINF